MALEARGSPESEGPSFGVWWWGRGDYFFVLAVGEVAGFVCGLGVELERRAGEPWRNWQCWQSGREVEELGGLRRG